MNVYLYILLIIGVPLIFALSLNLIGDKLIKNQDSKKMYIKSTRIFGPIVVVMYVIFFLMAVHLK
jgi:uncharacterized BrkB/YihY/UPF0761 family membrane protein